MEHLEEGTIHAWLDGALPPDESTRIERHAASCPTCAAAVAEARGLIAASSRILSALDEVPRLADAGSPVLRRGASDTKPGPQAGKGSARATRRPWFSPRYAVAAGIAAIAVVSTLVARDREQFAAGRTDDVATMQAPAAEAAKRAPDVAESAPQVADSGQGPAAAEIAPEGIARARDAAASNEAPSTPRRTVSAPSSASSNVPAMAPAPLPAAVDSTARALARESREQAVAQKSAVRDVAGAMDSSAAPAAPAQRLAPALRADEIARNERKRIASEPLQLDAVVTTGASAAGVSPVASAAGCWTIARSEVAREGGVPERVELTVARVGTGDAAPAWRALALGAGTSGDDWRWSPGGNGRFVLFHGPDAAAIRYVVVTDGVGRDAAASVGHREGCKR